jgi:class 3 adenylate cyclase/tetratricopeptide (TPR) repeat protein
MRCSECGSENREGRKFCTKCGTPLLAPCPKCGAAVEPDESFCGECGAALGATAPAAADATQIATASAGGERRHLTILFCDLVGSVSLTSQLDPEEWRATVASYQRAASESVKRFGGEVVRYVGDGIMAFFGYPVAHDNNAERAARAGLAILDGVAKLNESHPSRPNLSLRIGIDSGSVVVGTGAGQAVEAFGDAANIAARVQATATPDTVVVTAATHRLISGLFVVEDRGRQTLKGIEQPVLLYRVVRPSGMRNRFEAAAAGGGLIPFIGREEELNLLLNRWRRARDGAGQAVLIIGEAGIGKSRLMRHFRDEIATVPHTWLAAGAGAFFQNTPFHPVTELLRQTLTEGDPIPQLASRLTAAGVNSDDALPLLAPMLNLALPPGHAPSTLSPQQQRRRLLATLVEWLIGAALAQPVVSVIEDLHWADPSTLELIELLVEQGATAPLLLVYTARPEFRPSWQLREHHIQLTLNRLSTRETRIMVGEVTALKTLPERTVSSVIERTGGVPLFVEELTRALLEAGDGKLTERTIPATLHDSLMARLDRLGAAKEVAQVGSVIGAEFSYDLLHAVHPIPEPELQGALRSLTDAALLYVRGIAPDATYQFKHALIRDAAYEALLKSRRKELHLSVARTIDQQFSALKEAHPEMLAQHWTEAGESATAIAAWRKAGEQAMQRSANQEATAHFTRGLALIETLPDTPERTQEHLTLQTALGSVLVLTKGLGALEVHEAYDRARLLCRQLDDTPQLFTVLLGLSGYYLQQEDMTTSIELAQQSLLLAEKDRDSGRMLTAHSRLGSSWFFRGQPLRADEHCRRGMALYDFDRHSSLALVYGLDAGVPCWPIGAWALWYMGFPDQALRRSQEAVALARKVHHPYSLAWVLEAASWLHWYRGEGREAYALADEAVVFSTQREFPHWIAMGLQRRGEALRLLNHWEEGTNQLRQGLEGYRATGAAGGWSRGLTELARSCLHFGQYEEGLKLADEALEIMYRGTMRNYEPEQNRIKGELLLLKSRSSGGARRGACGEATYPDLTLEAEGCFLKALEIARRQKAKSWELRAMTSLARLLRDSGRGDEACTMLAEIYNWFTEGFDTADLKDAKALLDELAS